MKGLSSASNDERLSLASCTRTDGVCATGVGPGVLFLVFLDDCASLSGSVSVASASDTRCTFVLRLELGVFDRRVLLGVGSTSSCAKFVLLFLPRGVLGAGGGIRSRSSLSSPSSVPS